ncbi:hypothetical protein Tco_0051334 [Tanacetum coccineum]
MISIVRLDITLEKIASIATDALSRNERAKPLRVRALVMTINSNLPPHIHEAQVEYLKTEKVKDENLHGMDKELRLVLIELPALGGKLELRTWLNNSSDKVKAGRVRSHEKLLLVEAHKKGHADIERSTPMIGFLH